MPQSKIVLLLINILGGIAVIGSYVIGLNAKNGGADALWGGAPVSIRPIYTISMIISALGYFAFIYFVLFKIGPNAPILKHLYFVFLGILVFSAFWMPLTNLFIKNPNTFIWIAIRVVLAIVGISSCVLAWMLYGLHLKNSDVFYKLAVAGSIYFAFHTTILDAIFWPILFKK